MDRDVCRYRRYAPCASHGKRCDADALVPRCGHLGANCRRTCAYIATLQVFFFAIFGGVLISSSAGAFAASHTSKQPPTSVLPDVTKWAGSGPGLAPAAWDHALRLRIAYEISPVANRSAPVKTLVLAAYTRTALWVQFQAHDPDPAAVRVHYRRRDQLSSTSDDYVGFVISPFNDTQWAYEFFCTAGGSETDLFRQGNNEYTSFNAIWNCAARRTTYGYEVTIELPFRSLKFPATAKPQTWRLFMYRNWPRNFRYQLSGINFDQNDSCLLCQARIVHTETPITASGANVQLIPAATLSRTDQRVSPSSPTLVKGAPQLSGGLDARWQIRPDLEWSATLNPNYSEVAPDVLQLTVNRRFAILYPENRPFFQQGTWVFNTPLDLVDTRQVADPHWATKLVGQVGANAMGALVANDSITNILLPGPENSNLQSFDFGTRDGLLRYRRDFPGNSSIGFLATARQGGGYSNGVFSIDSGWQLDSSDALGFQAAGSDTDYPDAVATALGTAPGRVRGNAWELNFDRERTNYSATLQLTQLSQGFRADFGFIPQVGYLEALPQIKTTWYGPKNAWYQQWGVGSFLDWYRQTGGGPVLQRETQIFAYLHTYGASDIQLMARHNDVYVKGTTFGLNQLELYGTAQPVAWLYTQLDAIAGTGIDYEGARSGGLLSIAPQLTLDVGSHFQAVFVGAFERLNVSGGRLYTANLYDLRLTWNFNSRTFVRVIGQEQDIRRNVSLYPAGTASRTCTLATQWLFGYELNPWTSLYAGFTNGYLATGNAGLGQQQRTFFVKASYDFQV